MRLARRYGPMAVKPISALTTGDTFLSEELTVLLKTEAVSGTESLCVDLSTGLTRLFDVSTLVEQVEAEVTYG